MGLYRRSEGINEGTGDVAASLQDEQTVPRLIQPNAKVTYAAVSSVTGLIESKDFRVIQPLRGKGVVVRMGCTSLAAGESYRSEAGHERRPGIAR